MNSKLKSYYSVRSRSSRLLRSIYRGVTTEKPYLNFIKLTKKSAPADKIYDCFYFFNELDLLEIRLNVLDQYVDYFVIIESTTTFNGTPKKMIFEENAQRYEKYKNKIIYHQVTWSPTKMEEVEKILSDPNASQVMKDIAEKTLKTRNIPKEKPNSRWITEYFQKESMMVPLQSLKNDDIVYISDVDEIWNPAKRIENPRRKIFVFKQIPYIYFLNNRSDEFWHEWTGSIACKFSTLRKNGVNESRTHNRIPRYVIRNGGWHFSFQGGKNIVLEKLKAYPHLEYGSQDKQDKLDDFLRDRIHLKNASIRFRIDNQNLPNFIKLNRSRYSEMLL
jgi:beta-1,4-mannosyl-glycoprotein beta-1,4-N-acetylglucosaminyltransferase